jgi:methionine-rich copper-binding protein CopC
MRIKSLLKSGLIYKGEDVKSIAKTCAGIALAAALLNMPIAHANTLVATSPIAGSTLKAGPSAVTITTELPLIEEGNDIIVTDPSGKRVDTGILTVVGTEAVAEMKPLVTSGVYTVTYLLLAEADLPLEGSFTFNYSAIVISTPTPSVVPEPISSTPTQPSGSNFATNLFVIFLLGLSVLVLVGMGAYARKIFKER